MSRQPWADAATYAQLSSTVGGAAGLLAGWILTGEIVDSLAIATAAAIVSSALGGAIGFRRAGSSPTGVRELPSSHDDREIRQVLIDYVRETWIAGDTAPLRAMEDQAAALGTLLDPAVVVRPHPDAGADGTHLDDSRQYLEVYAKTSGLFVLDGDAGAGKTVWLWRLTRALLERAQHDATAPVPVVIDLGSWSGGLRDLGDLVAAELRRRPLGLTPRVVRRLIARNELVLLLDGFDELPPARRRALALVLDRYIAKQGALGHRPAAILSTRTADAARHEVAWPERIRWRVTLLALDDEQMEAALARLGAEGSALREALRANRALNELVRTPLWWTIAAQAFRGGTPRTTSLTSADAAELRRGLYDEYLARVYSRRPGSQRLLRGLGFLAHVARVNNRSVLSIADLTPDALPSPAMARAARLVAATTVALPVGVLVGGVAAATHARSVWPVFGHAAWPILLVLGAGVTFWRAMLALRGKSYGTEGQLGWSVVRFASLFPVLMRTRARPALIGGGVGVVVTSVPLLLESDDPARIAPLLPILAVALIFALWMLWSVNITLERAQNVVPTIGNERMRSGVLRRSAAASLGDLAVRLLVSLLTAGLLVMTGEAAAQALDLPLSAAPGEMVSLAVYVAVLISDWAAVPRFVAVGATIATSQAWRALPLKLSRMVTTAEERGLLYPAGDGYRFMHRTLQEHLADREPRPRDELPAQLRMRRAQNAADHGLFMQAVEEIDEALKLDARNWNWMLEKAAVFEQSGDWAAAAAAYDEIVRNAKQREVRKVALTNKAMGLFTLGRHAEAQDAASQAIKESGSTAQLARVLSGVLSLQKGDTRSARKHFRRAMRAHSPVDRSLERLMSAMTLIVLGKPDRGLRAAGEAIEMMPDEYYRPTEALVAAMVLDEIPATHTLAAMVAGARADAPASG